MTKVGFSRSDSLQGSLRDFSLADVLMGLQRGKETGILKVEGESHIKYVIIKKGEMIFALSSNKGDQLIEILLREKKITPEEYIRVERLLKKSKENAARILVTLGIMKPREVFNATKYEVELIVLSLFSIQEGKFIFLKGRLPEEDFPELRINFENIIYRGIKSLESLNHIKQAVPAPDTVLEVSPDAARLLQGDILDETDRQILSRINGERSLEEISRLSPSDTAETMKAICLLMSLMVIRVIKRPRESYDRSLAPVADGPHEEEVQEEEVQEEEVTQQTEVTEVSALNNKPSPETDDTAPQKPGESGERIDSVTPEEAATGEAPVEDTPAPEVEEQKAPETRPPAVEEMERETISESEAPEKKRSFFPIAVGIAAVIAIALFFFFRDSGKEVPPATLLLAEEVSSKSEEKQLPTPTADDSGNNAPVMDGHSAEDSEPVKPEPAQISVKEAEADKEGPQTQTVLAKEDVPSPPEKVDVPSPQEKVPEAVSEKSVTDLPASGDETIKDKEEKPALVKKKRPVPDKALFAAKIPRKEKIAPPKTVSGPPSVIDAVSEEEAARPKNEHFMRYKDQFNNNANKWETYNMTMAAARIDEGKYFIENKQSNSETLILHHADFPLDRRIAIEASIKVIKKDQNKYAYGFVIGAKDPSNYYALLVSRDNRFTVRKHHKGASQVLIAGGPGDGIILADSFNTLKIEIQGKKMIFHINGHRVGEVPDLTLFGKRIGFLVGGKSEIAVDYTRSQIWLD